jgi:hypothetical protein
MDARFSAASTAAPPRRACPAPSGPVTPSPGERGSKTTLAQAQRARPAYGSACIRATDVARNLRNTLELAKVQLSYQTILVHWREDGKESRRKPPDAEPRGIHPVGLRRAKAPSGQDKRFLVLRKFKRHSRCFSSVTNSSAVAVILAAS